MKVLDGDYLYEVKDGKPPVRLGKFELAEGERSGRMVIVERFSGSWCDLRKVKPSQEEQGLIREGRRILSEAGRNPRHILVLEGRFQMSDTLNANNRVYPDPIWEQILRSGSGVLKRIAAGEMLGEVDHPRDGETRLSRVSCMTTDLRRNENNPKEIIGRMVVFDTADGRDLKAIWEGGGRFGVSSRGQGSVVRMEGKDVVQEDYELECWDIVHNPSTPDAYPAVSPMGVAAETKEPRMNRLSKLQERFRRYKGRNVEGLSRDALAVVLDEVRGLKDELVNGPVELEESVRASSLATDVSLYLDKLERLWEKEDDSDDDEDDEKEKDSKKDDSDDENGDDEDDEDEEKEEKSEAVQRPRDREGALRALQLVEVDEDLSLPKRTKAVRTAYRRLVGAEGPLKSYELEAISHHLTEQVAEDPKPLTEDAINERGEIRVEALLEAQAAKTVAAVRESAASKAKLTEMSSKLAAAEQVISALVRRTKGTTKLVTEMKNRLRAAYTVIEALAEDADTERLKGAVQAIAATHTHVPNIVEKLKRSRSIREAVRNTNRAVIESLPPVQRDGGLPNRNREADKVSEEVEQALNESRNARHRRSSRSAATQPRRKPMGNRQIEETTRNVVQGMGGK